MRLFGIFTALLLIAGFIAFGGLLFGTEKEGEKTQEVELLSDEPLEAKKEDPREEHTEKSEDEMQTEEEEVPDAADLLRELELSQASEPALDAASLSSIEMALSGQLGSGDFADAVDFSSGGRIGALGKARDSDEVLETAFSMSEIDQKARAIFQTSPLYPAEMRSKKVEGVVTLIFMLDAAGKVTNTRVVKSSHRAFEKPALDAVKQWKFEPEIKGGRRVPSSMRVDIRFPAG